MVNQDDEPTGGSDQHNESETPITNNIPSIVVHESESTTPERPASDYVRPLSLPRSSVDQKSTLRPVLPKSTAGLKGGASALKNELSQHALSLASPVSSSYDPSQADEHRETSERTSFPMNKSSDPPSKEKSSSSSTSANANGPDLDSQNTIPTNPAMQMQMHRPSPIHSLGPALNNAFNKLAKATILRRLIGDDGAATELEDFLTTVMRRGDVQDLLNHAEGELSRQGGRAASMVEKRMESLLLIGRAVEGIGEGEDGWVEVVGLFARVLERDLGEARREVGGGCLTFRWS